jgi:hypothetical protein
LSVALVYFIWVFRDMVNFLQDWIVSPILNLLKMTTTYPGFKLGTFGLTVSIPNHHLGRLAGTLVLQITLTSCVAGWSNILFQILFDSVLMCCDTLFVFSMQHELWTMKRHIFGRNQTISPHVLLNIHSQHNSLAFASIWVF